MSKLKQILVSEIVPNVTNHGRLVSSATPSKELLVSIFTANHTATQPLIVVKIDDKKAIPEMEQLLAKKLLVLKDYNMSLPFGDKKVKMDERTTFDYKIQPKYSLFAGFSRLTGFHAKLALTGQNDLVWCLEVDSEEEAIELSRAENAIRNTGVTRVSQKDIFAMALAMVKGCQVTTESEFGRKTGFTRNYTQRVWSLAVMANRLPEIEKQVLSDNLGDAGVKIEDIPHTLSKKMLDSGSVEAANALVVEEVASKAGNKAKAVSGKEILQIAEMASDSQIRTLLIAIASGATDLAKVTVGELNARTATN